MVFLQRPWVMHIILTIRASTLPKSDEQRHPEIPKGDFSFQGGESTRWYFFTFLQLCLASLFMENIFIAVSLPNSSTQQEESFYQKGTGCLCQKEEAMLNPSRMLFTKSQNISRPHRKVSAKVVS